MSRIFVLGVYTPWFEVPGEVRGSSVPRECSRYQKLGNFTGTRLKRLELGEARDVWLIDGWLIREIII